MVNRISSLRCAAILLLACSLSADDRARLLREDLKSAERAMSFHDWDLARLHLERCLATPDNPYADRCRSRLAYACFQSGQSCRDRGDAGEAEANFKKAIALYDQLLKDAPDDAGLLYERALVHLASGQKDKAVEGLEKVVSRPANADILLDSLFRLGAIHAEHFEKANDDKSRDAAAACFERFLEKSTDPDSDRAATAAMQLLALKHGPLGKQCREAWRMYESALSKMRRGASDADKKEASDLFRKGFELANGVLSQDPGFEPAHLFLARLHGTYQAAAFYDPQKALACLLRAPGSRQANVEVGKHILLMRGVKVCDLPDGRRGAAELFFAKAISLDASDPSARYWLGVLRWGEGKQREAVEEWLAAIRPNPDGRFAQWAVSEIERRDPNLQLLKKEEIDLLRSARTEPELRYSRAQEKAWGDTQLEQVLKEMGGRPADQGDAAGALKARQQMLDAIAGEIIAGAQLRGEIPRHEVILVGDKSVNAMALPGGYVLVSIGMLDFVDRVAGSDERLKKDMLAFVLAHEFTHVARSHPLEQIIARRYLEDTVGVTMLEREFKEAYQKVENSFIQGRLRRHEFEADCGALRCLYRTRFDPGAGVTFLAGFLRQYGEEFRGADHPTIVERIDAISDYWNKEIRYADFMFAEGVRLLGEAESSDSPEGAERARELFRQIAMDFPNLKAVQNNLGVACQQFALKKMSLSGNKFRPWRLSNSVDPRIRLKTIALKRAMRPRAAGPTDLEEAERAYQKAIELDPDYAEAWNNLGTLCMEKGDSKAARQCFETAQKNGPEDPRILGNFGVFCGWLADRSQGEAKVKLLHEATERLKQVQSPAATYNLGICYSRLMECPDEAARKAEYASLAKQRMEEYLKTDPYSEQGATGWAMVARGIYMECAGQ